MLQIQVSYVYPINIQNIARKFVDPKKHANSRQDGT